jgi:hypothetical protein
VEPGLCTTCKHSRTVTAARSTFWMCERSKADASFPRYPRLPVLQCRGYEALGVKEPERPAP